MEELEEKKDRVRRVINYNEQKVQVNAHVIEIFYLLGFSRQIFN